MDFRDSCSQCGISQSMYLVQLKISDKISDKVHEYLLKPLIQKEELLVWQKGKISK